MSDQVPYRMIESGLPDSPEFQSVGPDARFVLVILRLTMGASGIAVKYAAELEAQTALPADRVAAALEELEASGWIKRERNVIWVVEHMRRNPAVSNHNHILAVSKHLKSLPRLGIVDAFRAHYTIPVDGMGDGIPNPSRNRREEKGEKEKGTTPSNPPNGAGAHAPGSGRPKKPTTRITPTPDEQAVLDAYRRVHPGSRPGGDGHVRLVRARLLDGYTAAELIEAIEGNAADQWHAAAGKHELAYVLRNRDQVDRFRLVHSRMTAPGVTPDGGFSPETLALLGAR